MRVSWVVCIIVASVLVVFRFVLGCLCFLGLLFLVIFVLVFNWFLSKQTFNQYYLQAVPALILLAALALHSLFQRPLPFWGKVGISIGLVYLGIINPLANAIVPWTPDLQEKLVVSGNPHDGSTVLGIPFFEQGIEMSKTS